MKVRLNISGISLLYKVLGKRKEIDVEFPGVTLRDLAKTLEQRFGPPMRKAILDENGDIDMEIMVLYNNQSYLSENRMSTPLQEGDIIALSSGG